MFQQPHYTENFVQAIFSAMPGGSEGKTIVVGGDGRYWSPEVSQAILRLAAGNGIKHVVMGQDTILSTPAVSALIRELKTDGGILLTASHNPGGPENDFGIKFNTANGGPAPEEVTNNIYKITTTIKEYKSVDLPDVSSTGLATASAPRRWGAVMRCCLAARCTAGLLVARCGRTVPPPSAAARSLDTR